MLAQSVCGVEAFASPAMVCHTEINAGHAECAPRPELGVEGRA